MEKFVTSPNIPKSVKTVAVLTLLTAAVNIYYGFYFFSTVAFAPLALVSKY